MNFGKSFDRKFEASSFFQLLKNEQKVSEKLLKFTFKSSEKLL